MNPELRRNLWLEITVHRLVAMPAILGLLFMLLAALDPADAAKEISWASLVGFLLLTLLWGSRLAGNAIGDELADKTWDWQRLSTLGPWTMTWGKLLGAPAFAWYGGLICLAAFFVTSAASEIQAPFRLALALILLAVLMHAFTLGAALHYSRNYVAGHRRSIGLLPAALLLWLAPFVIAYLGAPDTTVHWFDADFEILNFILASTFCFASWALVGAYRTMCQSLAVRTTPWVWMLFLVFMSIYFAGFLNQGGESLQRISPAQAVSLCGVISGLFFTYIMIFTEPGGPVVLRRVAQKYKSRQWRQFWQEIPCWPLTWLYAALCVIALSMLSMIATDSAIGKIAAAIIPAVLLVARDASIFMFFAAAKKPKRVVGTTLVYLLLLYWIVPGLLHASHLEFIATLILPFGNGSPWAYCAIALAHSCVALWFAYRRVQVNFVSWRRADGE